MMVFDASTLILLAKIDLLDLFISNYGGQVLVPLKVKEEVLRKDGFETTHIAGFLNEDKIEAPAVKDKGLTRKLMDDFNIDSGEAEAIALALHNKGAVVATDDRNAIRACKFLKMDFVTAVSILVRAFEKGLLNKNEAILKLERLTAAGRYKEAIIADARRLIKGGD